MCIVTKQGSGCILVKSLEYDDRSMVEVVVVPSLVLPMLIKERDELMGMINTRHSLDLLEEILRLDEKIKSILCINGGLID